MSIETLIPIGKYKYFHVSKEYTPVIDPITRKFLYWQPVPGVTYNVGRRQWKRERMAAKEQRRIAMKAACAFT